VERKIVKVFNDKGFGFKVQIINAPMVKVRGDWVLDLNQNKLQKTILEALAHKPIKLIGNEIRFIRHFFEMTTTVFGQRFNVSHPAVLKWEKYGNRCTDMNWSTEKDIRLFIISRNKSEKLLSLYNELEEAIEKSKPLPVKVDAKEVA
jgi:DNA-binding transcriptional regulator YiaG